MTPRITVNEWEEAVAAAGPDPFARLQAVIGDTIRCGPDERLPELVTELARLVLVDPHRARPSLASLARPVENAVEVPIARTILLPTARLALLDLLNILSCVGVPHDLVDSDTSVNQWLLGLISTDLPPLHKLRLGFAALALGDMDAATAIATAAGRPVRPFDAGSRYRGDVWGLLGHLIGACQCDADRFEVLPAWRAVIELVTELRSEGQIDEPTLLWIARIVYHDLGAHSLHKVAEAAHEILWRVPDELEREALERSSAPAMQGFPIHYTLDNGAYVVDELLLGEGTQQLFSGHHVPSGAEVLVAYDVRGSRRSIAELRNAVSYQVPGVFDLGFAGGFDKRGGSEDYMCNTSWAIVERVTQGSWLPRIVPTAHDPLLAPEMAVELGLSAGRILACAEARGVLFTRIRPEYMWARHTAGRWEVTGLSARGDELFLRKSTEMVTVPLFDRYYYAPEWYRDPDDRALVFSLAVMIAEWAMDRYPFKYLFHGKGLEQADHLPIEAPAPLAALVEESLQVDRDDRPRLGEFLGRLEALASAHLR